MRPIDKCQSSWHPLSRTRTLKGKVGFISINITNYFSSFIGRGFEPNGKICSHCISIMDDTNSSESEAVNSQISDRDDASYVPPPCKKSALENLNLSLEAMPGVSPINFGKRNSFGQAKLVTEAVTDFKEKVFHSFEEVGVPIHKNVYDVKTLEKNSTDLLQLMHMLKTRIQGQSKTEQTSLLTMCPPSWTIHECAEFFEVSKNMIRSSRKKLKDSGIVLPIPTVNQGKKLSAKIKSKVTAFFYDDTVSRCCPGSRDVLSVKNEITGRRQRMQKRYLLSNMAELFQLYKENNPKDKIGKSRFFSLRPTECISQNTKGFHNVCLCVYHENVKFFMFSDWCTFH